MPERPPLTVRQREILALVEDSIAQRGFPPTRAEIAQAFGFRSANAAEDHLRALERKGAITIEGAHRGLRVLKKKVRSAAFPHVPTRGGTTTSRKNVSDPIYLPLIGRVAAGQPILAQAHVERQLVFDSTLFTARPDYLLRVHGHSMRDAGILDGDLVAVRRTAEARHGSMVVARIDDEATVKRLERRGERVRLLPANPDFAPIEVDLRRATLEIEGVVVGVIRAQMAAR